ncbi:hypothetical protein ACK3BK_23685 [Pseudomonas sp. L7]|uniref:hypothetical protein n=1 Tax=Pseudomonas sp. L7 TaxID=3388343 RepID=UPI003984F90D
MSDAATSLMKVLSALTSPKASVKFIAVAIFMIFSWKYVDRQVLELDVPQQYAELIKVFLGLGLGTLAGEGFYFLVAEILKAGKDWRSRLANEKERERNEAEKAVKLEQKKREVVESFVKAFAHYHIEKREILRDLTLRECCLAAHASDVVDLEVQGYIVKVVRVDENRNVYRLNAFIHDYVSKQWREEVEINVTDFLDDMSEDEALLLDFMDEDFEPAGKVISGPFDVNFPPIAPCFDVEMTPSGIVLSFKQLYREVFAVRTGRKFKEEVFIPDEYVAYQ